MAKVLVTGAGGYIGSVATYLLLREGHEVIAIDNFSKGFRQPLELLQKKFGDSKLHWYEKDIAEDLSEVFQQNKVIDSVLHYAAFCSVDESVKNPQKYFSNNIEGTANLVSQLIKNGIKNLVFSSTCAVYGNAQYIPIDEKHPTNPENPYGESKLKAEKAIQKYAQDSVLNYVILRYFNVCGASDDGLVGDSKKPSVHLMQNAIRGALDIEPFHLTYKEFKTPDGSPIRDYVNVVDLNEAHLEALRYLQNGGKSGIINLGTGTGNSVLEIVKKVQEVTGKKFELVKTTPRQGEYDRMIASNEKAKTLLNWEPKRSLEDSINSLLIWYKTYPSGWE